jgi:hypothetical protein
MAIIKRDRVQLDPRAAPKGAAGSCAGSVPKSARLVELEGRVIGIEFTCGCGERSLLELDFDGETPRAKER